MQLKLPSQNRASLFDEIINFEQLQMSFRAVRKNKGSAGIDGKTVEVFENNLNEELTQLHQELMSWSYEPMPVRRVEIPKPHGKGTRSLGVPTVRDRVVQTSIKMTLEPILDPTFSDSSFGFRPGRSQHQALLQAQAIVKTGKSFVVDIDLSKFFDRINHDRIISRLREHTDDKRLLRLIGCTLRSGVLINGAFEATTEGSVQGSPLSPLLSNLILDELDKELESRGLEFCRFADDCNIFVKTEVAATRVMSSVSRFIESKLKLVINKEKSKVAESRFVKFLGMTITGDAIAISKKALEAAYDKVKQLTPRGTHETIEARVNRINEWYRGWSNYFCLTQFPVQFESIEAHLRRRLRAMLISQHHRRRFLYKKLRDRGASHRQAAVAYTHRRTWALSITKAAHTAWPNEWFSKELGLASALDNHQKHWFKLKRWPKLN
jgi:group II intron reverse transcriptase/maturase